ncbi:RNA 2',3'-cyclic phosphodiesterase [Alkalibacterium sp. f15]|uniref:RNA 2',3'-cyclic phosphodiesterase n=1 Tax=Alkalibacterium sp. f15 TaxID=3414029 RepID=UPI003BF906ED
MRVFIAIEIGEQTKKQLKNVQDKMKNYVNKGNFTTRDNFHVTLRFIGDVDQEEIDGLRCVIDNMALITKPFKLSLDTLGHFPRKQKEIIWVGIKGQLDSLNELKRDLEGELEKAGFAKEEREYRPHITLVRSASLDKPVEVIIEEVSVPHSEIIAGSISLMESTRIDGELVYRSIYKKSVFKLEEQ